MIRYYEKGKIFKLDTKNSSYVIGIFDEDYIVNLFYGAYIPDVNLWGNKIRSRSASFSPSNPNIPNESFSTDVEPLEYSCNGNGDFRVSALEIENSDGNAVTDIRYAGHRIYKGKPDLKGLPHVYLNSEDEAETLELYADDRHTGARVTLFYTAFHDVDAIVRSVSIENNGRSPITLERVFSFCLDIPAMDFDLITLYGRHNKERCIEKRRLAHGVQGVASKRGASSHSQNPFAALLRHGAGEEQGDCFGFSFIYSGNFEFCAECDFSGSTRVLLGINPVDFRFTLQPGESFQAPEAVSVFSVEGLGGMSRTFHRLYSDNLIRGKYKKSKRPLLINSWEAAYFDFDAEKLVSFAKNAKELGMEMLVMDDGWFGKRNDDTCSLGDWIVNEEKLPGGVKSLSERIHALGMKFGIWFEPEMISPDSELFRAHPDWHVHVPGREPSIARHQYVLDVSREDVRENIKSQMYAVLSSAEIDYVKWDFNRNLSEAGSAALPAEKGREFFHRFVLGTYELLEWFNETFPDILLEGCSGGGGRFDPGMLYYSPQIWASDDTDPIERLSIQFGTSLCYPASSMGAHVSACRRTGYETKGNVALWGTFGFELDPTKLNDDDRKTVRKQTEEYHRYYDLIHYGDLYRLAWPSDENHACAWSFVSPEKTEVLLTVVVYKTSMDRLFTLRLKGLDPKKFYKNTENGEIYSGALLMNAGINLTGLKDEDGESYKIHFAEAE